MEYRWIVAIVALTLASPALADEGRDLCPDRPGLGTPACTTDVGDVVFELGIGDWTRARSGTVRTDILLAGDALVRIGVTPSLEAQVGWTALGRVSEQDRLSGASTAQTRTGDVTLALRHNLRNPDGSGFSIAAMPYLTLPVGRQPIGAGDWGAGFLLPVSVQVGALSLGLTPQISAAVNGDGDGRHLSFGSVAGVGFGVSDSLSMTAELSLAKDRDPAGHATEIIGGLSAGWQPGPNHQWDVGINVGLNRASPDVQIYAGFARQF